MLSGGSVSCFGFPRPGDGTGVSDRLKLLPSDIYVRSGCPGPGGELKLKGEN